MHTHRRTYSRPTPLGKRKPFQDTRAHTTHARSSNKGKKTSFRYGNHTENTQKAPRNPSAGHTNGRRVERANPENSSNTTPGGMTHAAGRREGTQAVLHGAPCTPKLPWPIWGATACRGVHHFFFKKQKKRSFFSFFYRFCTFFSDPSTPLSASSILQTSFSNWQHR